MHIAASAALGATREALGGNRQYNLCNYNCNGLHPSFGTYHNRMQIQSSKIFDFKCVARDHAAADWLMAWIWDVSQKTWSPGFLCHLRTIIHVLIVRRFVLTLEVIGVHNAHPSALTWAQGRVTPKKPLGCASLQVYLFSCFPVFQYRIIFLWYVHILEQSYLFDPVGHYLVSWCEHHATIMPPFAVFSQVRIITDAPGEPHGAPGHHAMHMSLLGNTLFQVWRHDEGECSVI